MLVKRLHLYGCIWDYWYDRSVRVWCAIELDSKGNQIGDAVSNYDGALILVDIGLELMRREVVRNKKDTAHAN